jgi:hypothetical protein
MKPNHPHFDLILNQVLLLHESKTTSEVNLSDKKMVQAFTKSHERSSEERLQNQCEYHSEQSIGIQSYPDGSMASEKATQTVEPMCSIYFGSSH